jgi:DNA-binding MarR family transcriptional regulator
MPETTAGHVGEHVIDVVDELRRDWLAVLLDPLIRAAVLLQPEAHSVHGHVSLSEWYALMELAGPVPLTQRDLAERLDLEKSTVSRLVAGLERRGLVTRRRNPDNRRFAQVALTEHARVLITRLAAGMLEHHAQISAAMTQAERDALATGVTALVRAMHGHHPQVHSPSLR